MAKPIEIGGYKFRSQNEALTFIASLRDKYEDGALITGSDADFLRELLLLHPDAKQKIGVGIDGFTVATEQVYKRTRHFVIQRSNETKTDFSFHSCIKGADQRRDRLLALRVAIADQIEAFKADAFEGRTHVKCEVRGILTAFADAQVDHIPPRTFSVLVQEWLAAEGIDLDAVRISDEADNQIVTVMISSSQRKSWQDFHAEHRRLRITCREANLSDVRRGTRAPKCP